MKYLLHILLFVPYILVSVILATNGLGLLTWQWWAIMVSIFAAQVITLASFFDIFSS